MTFGIVFLGLLVTSSAYAIGRTIYEKWIISKPLMIEEAPAVIPFHTAVRLAGSVARDRVIAEADTKVLVLPRGADGQLVKPENRDPGASTVDVQHNPPAGRRRRTLPPIGSLPMGRAAVVAAEVAA